MLTRDLETKGLLAGGGWCIASGVSSTDGKDAVCVFCISEYDKSAIYHHITQRWTSGDMNPPLLSYMFLEGLSDILQCRTARIGRLLGALCSAAQSELASLRCHPRW